MERPLQSGLRAIMGISEAAVYTMNYKQAKDCIDLTPRIHLETSEGEVEVSSPSRQTEAVDVLETLQEQQDILADIDGITNPTTRQKARTRAIGRFIYRSLCMFPDTAPDFMSSYHGR